LRTGVIAMVAGAVVARFAGGLGRWPMTTLLLLWPSFGGHWVEIWFLNWLRPRISILRGAQITARILTWFAGGAVLGIGMRLTAMALPGSRHWPPWWIGGIAFIGIELVVHVVPLLSGRPSFYDGRG
jgi:hypothetical protein